MIGDRIQFFGDATISDDASDTVRVGISVMNVSADG